MKALILTESEIAEAAEKIVAKYGFKGTLRGAILEVLVPTEVSDGAAELAEQIVKECSTWSNDPDSPSGPGVYFDTVKAAALIDACSRQVPRAMLDMTDIRQAVLAITLNDSWTNEDVAQSVAKRLRERGVAVKE